MTYPGSVVLTLRGLTALAVLICGWCYLMVVATGDLWYATSIFATTSSTFLVTVALAEALLCGMAYLKFSADQWLHKAWFLMLAAAGCRLAGWTVAHVLASDHDWNPIRQAVFVDAVVPAEALRNAGIVFSSPLAFALAGVGLLFVLKAYDEIGWMASLMWTDYVMVSVMAAQCANHLWLVYVNLTEAPGTIDIFRVLTWASEPLLLWLMILACRLRRAAGRMEGGWVARCWASYSVAVLLTCLGDVGIWAVAYQYVQWPQSLLTDLIWIPAAGAFALAPAYQVAGISDMNHAFDETGARGSAAVL